MRGPGMIAATVGAAMLVAACTGTPLLDSSVWRGPSLADMQQMCGEPAVDFGQYASAVHAATFDALVASRGHRVSHGQFCSFQTALAQQYATFVKSGDPQARAEWIKFLNDQRATAISWRAFVDPTLRAG